MDLHLEIRMYNLTQQTIFNADTYTDPIQIKRTAYAIGRLV